MTTDLFCVTHHDETVFVGTQQRCAREANQRGPDHHVEPFNTHRTKHWRDNFGLPDSLGIKET